MREERRGDARAGLAPPLLPVWEHGGHRMSKRGNPDYWKTAGHQAEDRDLDEAAKQRFGVSRTLWMRGSLKRPHPPAARTIDPIPITPEGDEGVPWRVVKPPVAERLPGEEPAREVGLAGRAAGLLVRLALAPLRAGLS